MSRAIAHRHDGDVARGVHGGLVGQEVLTLDSIGGSDRPGHVRLAGERWLAISGNDEPIPTGTSVVVTAVSGTTLTVWSLHPTGALDPVELDPVELEPVELDHPSPTEADPNHAPEGAEGTTA